VFFVANPNLKCAANHVKEFLAFVGVRLAATAAGLDAKEMRLHGLVAPGEKLHANAFCGFEDATVFWRNQAGICFGRVEERKKIRAIKTSDPSQRSNGSAHLATFKRAEESDGDASGASDLQQGKVAALAQATETLAGREDTFCGNGDDALTF